MPAIAIVRAAWFRLHVITRYRARTAVERWQIQDQLRQRLRRVLPRSHPRFYETAAGELAFILWVGWRPAAHLLDALRRIDGEEAGASAVAGSRR